MIILPRRQVVYFLFSYDISVALLNHSLLIAYKHEVYKALETL